ncbi:hypothetical protein [Haladaptatus sp. W1]|uniref:hypothetical protein n=1 Tax=Haladaptatus sp. W1 TaxID=1897478 RepID=UPI0020C7BC31|nr:hypothetical protein [Haladaptatus sp. W1]
MVSAATMLGLFVIILVNTVITAVVVRFFRLRLSTRWGAVVYTLLLVPLVYVVTTIVLSGVVGVWGQRYPRHRNRPHPHLGASVLARCLHRPVLDAAARGSRIAGQLAQATTGSLRAPPSPIPPRTRPRGVPRGRGGSRDLSASP